ncbi:MAG TPA: propanediol utilization protein, partial [Flavobacteriales bacterium]|nr:propanediol utilization protein [Flavobacteriales bacterium]
MGVPSTPSSLNKSISGGIKSQSANDQIFRTFRLALSCTAEYGNFFANTGTELADIQAAMAVTMNRVNGVYEIDLSVTMQLVSNNDLIIYWGSTNSDPWTNEWNNTTQTEIDNKIGNSNYDIGHNFNTTGGGNAGCISCVCTSGQKGSGYTGGSNPVGDPFDIDYVAHEMGHQFGGYHTMNTCSRSGSGQTEVEPASGSSIMGYAGICGTNVQNNSDAHFNYVNIRDMTANIQTG